MGKAGSSDGSQHCGSAIATAVLHSSSFLSDKHLDKITPEEVERYKTSRAAEFKTVRGKDKKRIPTKQLLRPATINRELACLRAMFNHAIKADASEESD